MQCGTIMYAVGSFAEIEWNGAVHHRANIFSFAAPRAVHRQPLLPGRQWRCQLDHLQARPPLG